MTSEIFTDSSTDNILSPTFSDYEEMETNGYCSLFKAKRYGKWFVLKGLKEKYKSVSFYEGLLKKEFELTIGLDHPNITKVIGFEHDERVGDCIVMDFVDGVTLDVFLSQKHKKHDYDKLINELLDAMTYFHGLQIVHRDLKPSNILITRNANNVKIIDFGLADADNYDDLKQPAGTLKYESPEQLDKNISIDCRSDIFSFGKIIEFHFPKKYRWISKKCVCKNRDDRYANALKISDAIKKRRNLKRIFSYIALFVVAVLMTLKINDVVNDFDSFKQNVVEYLNVYENRREKLSQQFDYKEFEANGYKFKMMFVEGDSTKNISDFYISELLVTQRFWTLLMGKNEYWKETFGIGENYPATAMTYGETMNFISKLNELCNNEFRLPTAAEWEFAAHGGNKSRGYKYAGNDTLEKVACSAIDCKGSEQKTFPVGTKLPNELGIYDMTGNCWELTSTVWGVVNSNYYEVRGGYLPLGSMNWDISTYLSIEENSRQPWVGFRLLLITSNS